MKHHPNGISFSTTKPNVIIGPNGSGKSALLKTLSLATLSWLTGQTSFDRNYLSDFEFKGLWGSSASRWSSFNDVFMPGLTLDSDNLPAVFFRPGALPGDEVDLAHSFCRGYGQDVRRIAPLIKDKSSGQQHLNMMLQALEILTGKSKEPGLIVRWNEGTEIIEAENRYCATEDSKRVNTLKMRFRDAITSPVSTVLMDEPEQSLDARAEINFWKQIEKADSGIQVILASHSLYPILHPDSFNLIEAEPGYARSIRALI